MKLIAALISMFAVAAFAADPAKEPAKSAVAKVEAKKAEPPKKEPAKKEEKKPAAAPEAKK